MYQGPFYRYNIPVLNDCIRACIASANEYRCEIKYALKANNEKRILEEIKKKGLGIDCVSAEEIEFALELGWSPSSIVFAGSGKTIREIQYALENNIGYIHCESTEEYHIIVKTKFKINSTTKIALRINPDLKVDSHEKISTGEKHHKFGMAFNDALSIVQNDHNIVGFHFHIGSQILNNSFFEDLSLKVRSLMERLPQDYQLKYLNLGGGLGINYSQPEKNLIPDFNGWMKALRTHLPVSFIDTITLEPGRSIVGQCGQLVGEVQYIKNIETCPTAILDVGMTELLRPALYGARHKITTNNESLVTYEYTVSGPSCESSDTFGTGFKLPILTPGDLITIHSTGAYGSSMRLSYNLKRPLPIQYIEKPVNTIFKSIKLTA